MLCPNCGTQTTTDHKFCRNCGMNLEPVAHALAAHLSTGGASAAAREAEHRAVRRMTRGLLAGIIVILLGVFMMAAVPGNAFKVLGVAAALIGIVAALAAVFSTLRSAGDAGGGYTPPAPHAPEGMTPPTGRLLHEQTFEPVPGSVTERTTDLLGVEVKERKPRA